VEARLPCDEDEECVLPAIGTALRIPLEDAEAGGASGLTLRSEKLWRIGVEGLSCGEESLFANAVGEDAVASDAYEARGQDVVEEAPGEGTGVDADAKRAAVVLRVATAEGDVVAVVVEQAAVGDGDPAGVACEVLDDLLGSGEWAADVDVPVVPCGVSEELVSGSVHDGSAAVPEQCLELAQELALEEWAQDPEREQEAAALDKA
jgi:hypothetical protein